MQNVLHTTLHYDFDIFGTVKKSVAFDYKLIHFSQEFRFFAKSFYSKTISHSLDIITKSED